MFSLQGRIGRWDYFKGCLALGGACLVPVIVVLVLLGPVRAGNTAAVVLLVGLLAVCAIAIVWFSLVLQARRFRDIGWNPVVVLPAWLALQASSALLAYAFPGSTMEVSIKAFAALADLLIGAALLFWPGMEDAGPPFDLRDERRSLEPPPAKFAPRRDPSPAMPGAGPAFGRRGVT